MNATVRRTVKQSSVNDPTTSLTIHFCLARQEGSVVFVVVVVVVTAFSLKINAIEKLKNFMEVHLCDDCNSATAHQLMPSMATCSRTAYTTTTTTAKQSNQHQISARIDIISQLCGSQQLYMHMCMYAGMQLWA